MRSQMRGMRGSERTARVGAMKRRGGPRAGPGGWGACQTPGRPWAIWCWAWGRASLAGGRAGASWEGGLCTRLHTRVITYIRTHTRAHARTRTQTYSTGIDVMDRARMHACVHNTHTHTHLPPCPPAQGAGLHR